MTKMRIRTTVLSAVFTALIAASAFFTIPVGPIPIVLTTMFILLSGMLGGAKIGFSAVATYLILGIIGLPVFAGGTGGIAKLIGPTGGFLVGYLLAAPLAGLIYNPGPDSSRTRKIILAVLAALVGGITLYIPGIPWLKQSLSMDWPAALQAGLIPFIPGDLIKCAAAAVLAVGLKDRFRDFLTEAEEE